MAKRTPPKKATAPPGRQPKPLTAEQVQKHLARLPGWQAVGGNQELVGRYRLPDLAATIMAVATTLVAVDTWSQRARVEVFGREVVVRLSTPAIGAVTLTDVRLAGRLSDRPVGLAGFEWDR